MSRSRRKTPVAGLTTARSDKPFKVDEHRRERRILRNHLSAGRSEDDARMHAKVFGNPWQAPKDGKASIGRKSKDMRK